MHIVYANLGQSSAGDIEVKLMMKYAPEWVRNSNPVIRSPALYLFTTASASGIIRHNFMNLMNFDWRFIEILYLYKGYNFPDYV